MKNCIFQYATSNKLVEDTGLITAEEAESLYEKYLPHFKESFIKELNPEMAIWINCENESDYKQMGKYLNSNDLQLIDGILYQLTRLE